METGNWTNRYRLCSQEPGGKDPRSRRAWTQRTWLDWEPSYALMLCSQEPGGKDPRLRRAWTRLGT